jgi:cyclopropane-fatty-acyl-phospholipid synthase
VYLYGCAEMFRSPAGRTHLFQIVFSKGNVTQSSYPMGRDFLYEEIAELASAPRRVGHG